MAFDPSKTSTIGSESSNASPTEGNHNIMGKPSVYKRLRDLFVSESNVRKSGKPVNIPELAAMIDAQGLLQALHISSEKDASGSPTGRCGVEAGGRRYRALMLLVEQGKASLDDLIECKEVDEGNATGVSLAENLGQVRMHPSDEFTAFQDLVNQGKTVKAIAAAYGETVAHVNRRLRLANVEPSLLDIFRKGEMTLDLVMALASTEDQERQLNTWKSLSQWDRNAGAIRRKLNEFSVSVKDPRVLLIGLKNYLEAGGTTEIDLFTQGEPKTLTDMGLVDLLLGAKIDDVVAEVENEGWAWVARHTDFDYDERRLYETMPKVYTDETPKQAKARKALEAALLESQDKLNRLEDDEDADYDQTEAAEEEVNAIAQKIDALKEERVSVDALDKTQCGAVVAFEGSAGIVVYRGMVLRGAKGGAGAGGSGSYEKPKAEKAEFPEKLMMNLTSHRTAAIQASMLGNQAVSLAALAHTFALSLFSSYGFESPLKIRLTECRDDLTRNSDTLDASRAAVVVDAATAQWKAALPANKAEWLGWFIEQPQATVLEFIVYASAVSANTNSGHMRTDVGAAKLANALALDMTQWWVATPETYFDLVPKSKLAGILRETSTEEEALALEKMKKADAVAHTVTHTADKAWLPMPLRPVVVVDAPADEDDGGDVDNDE